MVSDHWHLLNQLLISCRATTRPCDQKAPEDLIIYGYTHLNFGRAIVDRFCLQWLIWLLAFAFFHPTTFQMTAMDSTSAALYRRFTALKSKQPYVIHCCQWEKTNKCTPQGLRDLDIRRRMVIQRKKTTSLFGRMKCLYNIG